MSRTTLLARFRKRTPAEKRLLVRTGVLFAFAHVLSHRRELARARANMTSLARRLHAKAATPNQLGWAVAAVNRDLPGRHSCLISALVCEAIATNSNIDIEFRIGAAHQQGRMHFHAWVEHRGAALTGAHHGEFVPLR